MRIFIFLVGGLCFGAGFGKPLAMGFEARGDHYVSNGPGYSLEVTPQGAVLHGSGQTIRMQLKGAGASEGLDRMPGRANYFRGREARSYALFGRVRSRGVYPGIDVVFHGNQDRLMDNSPQNGAWSRPAPSATSAYREPRPALCGLEYDFEAAAGSDVSQIRIGFEGTDLEGKANVRIDADGELVVRAGGLEVRQPVPFAYQVIDGKQRAVRVAYRMEGSNRVRFEVGPYDRGKALVIDPQLVFESLFGRGGTSSAADVALDAAGNIYVAGQTNSVNFPAVNAEQAQPGAAPLLESADGGQTWTPVFPGSANTVRWIASSPVAPSTLYAVANTGVIVSTNGGTTWTAPANAGLTVMPVAVAGDKGSASTVYAATQGQGVFVSTNGGASWTQSTSGLAVANSTPVSYPQFIGIWANPQVAGNVFAVSSAPDFVYESTNAGQTWTQVNIPAGGGPLSVAFGPLATASQTIFVGQNQGPVLTSTDGGNTWSTLSTAEPIRNTEGLAVQPANPFVLLGAGFTEVSRSTDGGQTWTGVLALAGAELAFDPKNANTAYALNGLGLYRSTDGGQTWSMEQLPYTGSSTTVFVSAADSRVFIGEGLDGAQTDAFVTKYSADGSTILYSTYLGGNSNDGATGIAVDASGSAYVVGMTGSPNFPVTSGAFQTTLGGPAGTGDAFVARLSADGARLVYSTFLGGGAEQSSRIAVDSGGEAEVTGSTSSANFPVTAGAYQTALNTNCNPQAPLAVPNAVGAFVTKLSATGGSLVFSTLLGGSCATGGQAVALDASGDAWVAGYTTSPDFPVTSNALQRASGGDIYDGFLAQFTPAGSLAYATYIGGPGYDTITGIALDKSGNVYLTGTSGGLNEAPSPGAYSTHAKSSCPTFSIGPAVYQVEGAGFVLKLDPAAQKNLGLTYLGYPFCLFPADIAVDAQGEPWIAGPVGGAAGASLGTAVPTASPLRIALGNGFLSKFSADFTQLLFSTYFDQVSGLTLDANGLAYPAGASSTGQAYVAKVSSGPAPAVELDSVQNAAQPGYPNPMQGIGPGEYLRLIGKNMGPAKPAMGIIQNGVVTAGDAGVAVMFDGTAVPLLMVSATEIDLMAPFEVAGKSSTTMQVSYEGVQSNPAQVGVFGTPLQVLGVFNQGFTVNSASNPAQLGSMMSLYVAGAGQTNPPSVDGQVNGFPLPSVAGAVQITGSGGIPIPATFAGAAPGLAAGIFQINFQLPLNFEAAPAGIPGVVLSVGTGVANFAVYVQ